MNTNYRLPETATQIRNILITIVCCALLMSCAGLDGLRMAPQFDQQSTNSFHIDDSIISITVRGEKEEIFSGPAYAKKEQIQQALIIGLRNANFFNSVDEGKGTLNLTAIVRSQGQSVSGMLEYRAKLTISYRITDTSGKLVWFKTYESEFSSHAFSGATRTVEAREGSVRENLQSFIKGLQTSWEM